MLIKEMFEKDIQRSIQGVIKVAQTTDENIYQELEEYVVTTELKKHLSKFYGNYKESLNRPTDKMGVWISGFFGSGKSHFLKILSYLLENKSVVGKKATEFFDSSKIEDSMLLADIKRVGSVPTEVILFNIDSKSSADGKSLDNSILKVFMKVFYEHQGFYGQNPGIAEMEKYLVQEGKYETFKKAYFDIKNQQWTDRRHLFRLEKDTVVKALSKATEMSEETARGWVTKGVDDYEISIEKFVRDINEYVQSKDNDFRLIFLVDEVGQYIGEDQKLMLNLQTLVEDLGTHCAGKVWVMVTSQESIDTLVKVKGNDFSKIQGRFDTRLSLSSISVDEVIKKRILSKKTSAQAMLKVLYHDKSAELKNALLFKDARSDLMGYENEEEFQQVYPFVPYQLKLLQLVYEQIRRTGSSGKHLSEGERSLLSAFKESAILYMNESDGTLVPFYAFYDTIKEFLTGSVTRVVEGAEKNPALIDDYFNINLLKLLFMLKYIKELPPTVDNLATLMITQIDIDKIALKEKIKISLEKLIKETLIQKNGDQYIFLTDNEQDINREIKQIKVDTDTLKKELRIYLYEELYDEKKLRYSKYYQIPFNKKMDEKEHGHQTAAITLHVISPLSDLYDASIDVLKLKTAGTGEMIVKLNSGNTYIEEFEEALKILEYTGRINNNQLEESKQSIINGKRGEVSSRRIRAKSFFDEALKNATFIINGSLIYPKGASVKERLNNALSELVIATFTKIGYITSFLEKESDLNLIIKGQSQQTIAVTTNSDNKLAIEEVAAFISLQEEVGKQLRVKLLMDRFVDKPYGWRDLEIGAILATLFVDQKIKFRYKGDFLDGSGQDTFNALTKTTDMDSTIITRRIKTPDSLLKSVREICKEVWNRMDLPSDEDGLADEIKKLVDMEINSIKDLLLRYESNKYPGKSLLEKGNSYFSKLIELKDNYALFKELQGLEDDLLDWQDDMINLKNFFINQVSVFESGVSVLNRYDEFKSYLDEPGVEQSHEVISEIISNPIPYKWIKDIPAHTDVIQTAIQNVLNKQKEIALQKISSDYNLLLNMSGQSGVTENTIDQIKKSYESLLNEINTTSSIFKVVAYVQQSQIWREDKFEPMVNTDLRKNNPDAPLAEVKRIRIRDLFQLKSLQSEEDVDHLLLRVGEQLKRAIKENKNIELVD